MSKMQLRGNCPCCGREQAVINGNMSKHGYTVENGWFNGVCSGDRFAPMQVQRTVTDDLVKQVLLDVEVLKQNITQLESGKIHPTTCPTDSFSKKTITWEEANEYQRKKAVSIAVSQNYSRARQGEVFAQQMSELVNAVHGKELRQVALTDTPEPIKIGERKMSKRGPLTVIRIDGARVYWRDERGKSSWTGSSAWRRMENVS